MATSSSPTGGASSSNIPMAAVASKMTSPFQINNNSNPQRKRRRLEDAFRTMSLQPPATDTLSSSFFSSSILPSTSSSINDEIEHRSCSMEEEIESDDEYDSDGDGIHSTSKSNVKNNLALYNLLVSSSNGNEKVLRDFLNTATVAGQSQSNNPVDNKIEELVRSSRIRAVVETLQQRKGGEKGKSKKRTNRIQDCMVTKDDFHLKESHRGRTLNRNLMGNDKCSATSNGAHKIRSNSLPREMKYTVDSSSTPQKTQTNDMDVQM